MGGILSVAGSEILIAEILEAEGVIESTLTPEAIVAAADEYADLMETIETAANDLFSEDGLNSMGEAWTNYISAVNKIDPNLVLELEANANSVLSEAFTNMDYASIADNEFGADIINTNDEIADADVPDDDPDMQNKQSENDEITRKNSTMNDNGSDVEDDATKKDNNNELNKQKVSKWKTALKWILGLSIPSSVLGTMIYLIWHFINEIGQWICEKILSKQKCESGACKSVKQLFSDIKNYQLYFYLGVFAIGFLMLLVGQPKWALIIWIAGGILVYALAGPFGKWLSNDVCTDTFLTQFL